MPPAVTAPLPLPRLRSAAPRAPARHGHRPAGGLIAAAALSGSSQDDMKKMGELMEAVQASLAAQGKTMSDTDAFADVMCEELEKAVKDGGLPLNGIADRGEYTGYGGGGPIPVYLQLAQACMGANAKVLRLMLKLGADPNLPCEAYSYPNVYHVTPLTHFIVTLIMTGMADGMYMDIASAAEALLDAGADINGRVNIKGQCNPGADPPLIPYTGPPMDFTAVMMLANTGPTTGGKGCELLRLLVARGADLNAKAGDGKATREMPMSGEATAILNA
jgi:hypothetical protein